MPEDLRSGPGVTLVTMLGNSSRFDGVDPRCVLVGEANLATGTFQIQQNCMRQGGLSIVQQMNSLIAKGVVITTGLAETIQQTVTACPASRCRSRHCSVSRFRPGMEPVWLYTGI